MRLTTRIYASLILPLSLLAIAHSATAASSNSAAIGVVELFTSHGCYSCPPADEALAEMLEENDNFVALEFHVDYWNELVWGSDGKWHDPFSKPEYTFRQQRYNQQNLQGRTGVYTPQGVVNGQYAMVGVSAPTAKKVFDALPINAVNIHLETDQDQMVVTLDNPKGLSGANVYLARFLKKTVTDITGGENNGKSLSNVNVVTTYDVIGELSAEGEHRFVVASQKEDNTGCAVLVQSAAQGPILGATLCP